jgi:hypothetical protein
VRKFAIVMLLVVAACDTSGIHALGRLRDALVPCDADPSGRVQTTSTWIRSTDEGTEIFLLGRPDPTVVVKGAGACYGHGFVAHDGTTHFAFGSYTLGEDGEGFAVRTLEYVFEQQRDRSLLSRDGATRFDLPTPLSDPLLIAAQEDDQIILTLAGEARRLTHIGAVVKRLDGTTQEGAEDIFRVFNLPMFTSQARLLGFGSSAMTQYWPDGAEFIGTIRNRFTVKVESLLAPNTLIYYYQLEDLTGIVIDGPQKTNVNGSGNGSMDGTLNFLMTGPTGPDEPILRGHLDYEGLQIRDGFAAGGSYHLGVDGVATEWEIPWELNADIDLRRVLPVEMP